MPLAYSAAAVKATLPPLLARDTAICVLLVDFLARDGLVVSLKKGKGDRRNSPFPIPPPPPIDRSMDFQNAHDLDLSFKIYLFTDRGPHASLQRRGPGPARPRRRRERSPLAHDARRAGGEDPRLARGGPQGELPFSSLVVEKRNLFFFVLLLFLFLSRFRGRGRHAGRGRRARQGLRGPALGR